MSMGMRVMTYMVSFFLESSLRSADSAGYCVGDVGALRPPADALTCGSEVIDFSAFRVEWRCCLLVADVCNRAGDCCGLG